MIALLGPEKLLRHIRRSPNGGHPSSSSPVIRLLHMRAAQEVEENMGQVRRGGEPPANWTQDLFIPRRWRPDCRCVAPGQLSSLRLPVILVRHVPIVFCNVTIP
ncbi:hypothetical protein C8034_v000183 [Colletotrichum sidae]|uniref:Uncharacterized protein n=1 Tax=Colletotrichum sidae TaxID=1347389 RepID=A0A4R8TNA1_9PEZI|nr:hypothetical protein C8034_v000183 [Colletotrichum sidae]